MRCAGQLPGGGCRYAYQEHLEGSEDKESKENYTFNGQMAVLTLDDEIDVSRGDMIVRENNLAEVNDNFEAAICWMSNQALSQGKNYLKKSQTLQCGYLRLWVRFRCP